MTYKNLKELIDELESLRVFCRRRSEKYGDTLWYLNDRGENPDSQWYQKKIAKWSKRIDALGITLEKLYAEKRSLDYSKEL